MCFTRKKNTPASCYTSIKTRIETADQDKDIAKLFQPLATLPSKQGLKHAHVLLLPFSPWPLATLPSKQGLKRKLHGLWQNDVGPLATLPSKQGLKHNIARYIYISSVPLATLPSKQGLKHEITAGMHDDHAPLATLPSKQGLKHERGVDSGHADLSSCYTSIKTRIETGPSVVRRWARVNLLLHFHQNKD